MLTFGLSLSALPSGAWTLPATLYNYDEADNPEKGISVAQPTVTLSDTLPDGSLSKEIFTNLSFGGTKLHAASGLVTVQSGQRKYFLKSYTSIVANGPWNLVKNLTITSLSAQVLDISNFVDVRLDLSKDKAIHEIDVDAAKRGSFVVNGTTMFLNINYLSNEYGWSNVFDVKMLWGNLHLNVKPMNSVAAAAVEPLTPMTFNTAPQRTVINVDVGNGTGFHVINSEEVSANVHLGPGTTTLNMVDGHNEVWTGTGVSRIDISSRSVFSGPGLATDIGSDLIHFQASSGTVFLDDATKATEPTTTLELTASLSNSATAPLVAVISGHWTGANQTGTLVVGDLSHLTLAFHGFGASHHLNYASSSLPGTSTPGTLLTATDPTRASSFSVLLEYQHVGAGQVHVLWT